MEKPKTKHFIETLDDFLKFFDPEEMIKEGITAVRFTYKHGKHFYTQLFTVNDLKQEKKL